MRRLFSCEGSIQLVAALAAARAFARTRPAIPTDDWLVIHSLCASDRQTGDFVRVLRQMADSIGCWRGIIHLGAAEAGGLQGLAGRSGRRPAAEALKRQIGLERVDELYIGQNRTFANLLLLNAYAEAEKVCYGDAIGINFSPGYFAAAPLTRDHTRLSGGTAPKRLGGSAAK